MQAATLSSQNIKLRRASIDAAIIGDTVMKPTVHRQWHVLKSSLSLFLFAGLGAPAMAAPDVYDAASNQLTIPSLTVGNARYTNVVVTIGGVASVGAAPAQGAEDSFDGTYLNIPSVSVNGAIYYNLKVSIGKVVSVGPQQTTAQTSQDPTVVQIDAGLVKGVKNSTTLKFLGIPYAAPPVGNLRWRAPQAVAAWSGTRDASQFGKHCPNIAQGASDTNAAEDCLYLNVTAPTTAGTYPVMVWVHGGDFTKGNGETDTSKLVEKGVVVVTINYRLGPLGFLAHPALSAEAGGSSGNYGLMDQQAALQWIQRNIAAFGGDKNNVTLFGQSAGGLSVLANLTSPTAAGLFHKAIVQSGTYTLVNSMPTQAQAESAGQSLANLVGCTDQTLSCLRNASPVALLSNYTAITFSKHIQPHIDGKILTNGINRILTSGQYNQMPVMIGATQHENSTFSVQQIDPVLGHPIGSSDYPTYIASYFSSSASSVLAQYPLSSSETPAWTFDRAHTDKLFSCQGRKVARTIAGFSSPIYFYEFADNNAPVIFSAATRQDGLGAYHMSELPYLFPGDSNWHFFSGLPISNAQLVLSDNMLAYWTQFAKNGNPTAAGYPAWPAYTVSGDAVQSLAPSAVQSIPQYATQHNCSFWTPGI